MLPKTSKTGCSPRDANLRKQPWFLSKIEWAIINFSISNFKKKSPFKFKFPPCLFRSLPIRGMWGEESPKTWLLQGSWARFHSPWCRAWHEYCWWCNDLSIGKTDFFFPSVPYGTLWDLQQYKPSLKSFCFAWEKFKNKKNKKMDMQDSSMWKKKSY